ERPAKRLSLLSRWPGQIPGAVGVPDDPYARAIDFDRLDGERASEHRRRQIDSYGIRLEEWHLTARRRQRHLFEVGGQRERVVVEAASLQSDPAAGELAGCPCEDARPDDWQMNGDEEEDEESDEHEHARAYPSAPRMTRMRLCCRCH